MLYIIIYIKRINAYDNLENHASEPLWCTRKVLIIVIMIIIIYYIFSLLTFWVPFEFRPSRAVLFKMLASVVAVVVVRGASSAGPHALLFVLIAFYFICMFAFKSGC